MPFAEAETALATTIGDVAGPNLIREKIARPEGSCGNLRIFNHLHGDNDLQIGLLKNKGLAILSPHRDPFSS